MLEFFKGHSQALPSLPTSLWDENEPPQLTVSFSHFSYRPEIYLVICHVYKELSISVPKEGSMDQAPSSPFVIQKNGVIYIYPNIAQFLV